MEYKTLHYKRIEPYIKKYLKNLSDRILKHSSAYPDFV